ncbi:hypothetical protein J3R82DRAFT_7097 [Butyriboletus roseoflavus]|nr:hypothetical protein J3R82DRAFT_7097 [Butyriboletus roseoflavus]
MATTSQTYLSPIPTSTIVSSSSTPTSNSSEPTDDISDLFSSAGSPPLIVAFLSIGLFVVAMVGVFGWKRVLRSRDDQVILPHRTHKSISLGERPMLWDVWADPKVPEKSRIEARRWENMMVRPFVRSRQS